MHARRQSRKTARRNNVCQPDPHVCHGLFHCSFGTRYVPYYGNREQNVLSSCSFLQMAKSWGRMAKSWGRLTDTFIGCSMDADVDSGGHGNTDVFSRDVFASHIWTASV